MELKLTITGKIGKDFPEKYFQTPEAGALFVKASESALRKRYNMGEEVKIVFEVT